MNGDEYEASRLSLPLKPILHYAWHIASSDSRQCWPDTTGVANVARFTRCLSCLLEQCVIMFMFATIHKNCTDTVLNV